MGTYAADFQTLSVGLLVVRVVVGLVMAGHGAQKLFGWFGGYGVRKTGEFFAQVGFRPGTAFAAAASISEIASGLLVTFGFLGPVGPALMVAVMIVAAITVHWGQGIVRPEGRRAASPVRGGGIRPRANRLRTVLARQRAGHSGTPAHVGHVDRTRHRHRRRSRESRA